VGRNWGKKRGPEEGIVGQGKKQGKVGVKWFVPLAMKNEKGKRTYNKLKGPFLRKKKEKALKRMSKGIGRKEKRVRNQSSRKTTGTPWWKNEKDNGMPDCRKEGPSLGIRVRNLLRMKDRSGENRCDVAVWGRKNR